MEWVIVGVGIVWLVFWFFVVRHEEKCKNTSASDRGVFLPQEKGDKKQSHTYCITGKETMCIGTIHRKKK